MLDKLLDIENIPKNELGMLKSSFINEWNLNPDNVVSYYNSMTMEQLNALANLVGFEYVLNSKAISSIEDKSKLCFPYSLNLHLELSYLDREIINLLLSYESFYSTISSEYKIGDVSRKIDNDLKKKFYENCVEFIPQVFKSFLKNKIEMKEFIEYIDDNIIIKILKCIDDSNSMISIFENLSDSAKDEVYNSDWFRAKVDINNSLNQICFMDCCTEAILDDVLSKNKFSAIGLLKRFEENRKSMYINKFIELAQDNELCSEFELFMTKNIFFINENIYSEIKNKERLYNLIDNMSDELFIKFYFSFYITFKNQAQELKDYLFNRASKVLENNDFVIDKLSINLLNNADDNLFNLVAHNISKEDLLLLSVRYEFFYKYTLNLLNDNPNYFNNVVINNTDKYKCPDLTDDQLNRYTNIANFLNDEQLSIYYLSIYVESNSNIRNSYLDKLKISPDNLSNFSDITFFDDEVTKYVFNNISIERFAYLCLMKNYKIDKEKSSVIKEIMSNRIFELSDYINANEYSEKLNFMFNARRFLNFLNPSDYKKFLDSLTSYSCLCRIYDDVYNKEIKKLIEERLAELYNHDDNIGVYTTFPVFLDDNMCFYDRLSFDTVLSIAFCDFKYIDSNDEKYKKNMQYITRKLDEDINSIFNINIIVKLDEMLQYIPQEYQSKITNYIDSKYEQLKNRYPKFNEFINSYSDKANYVYSVENNYINDNNYDKINELLDKNLYLFNSMDFRLLTEDISKLGDYFIDKTSRYPKVADKVYSIYKEDINKFNILVLLSNKIRKENNDSLYDQKMELIINYLEANDIKVSKVDDNVLTNIESYILEKNILRENKYSILNIENYIDEKNKLLDLQIASCNELEKLRELVYRKYFGLNSIEINKFLMGYATNYHLVSKYSDNDLPGNYIELIYKINSINDVVELKEIMKNLSIYTISDNLIVKSIMIDSYNKCIIDELNVNIDNRQTININGIEVEDYTNKFGLFVHSTDAYGSMPLINNDYFDSWNYNPNTKNHGICTSYISNSSYGTAAVNGNGVMFGFYNLDNNSIPIMAPYDLATTNEGYTIHSTHKPYFTNLKGMSDYTRHTHNEATLERRIFKDGNFVLRQPDCIIIFEDMSDAVKQNSIKAYNDFKNHGYDLKLVYIDRVKNCRIEATKISMLMDEYEKTYDLDILREIINKYESNICGCDYLGKGKKESLGLFEQKELFMTDKLKHIINNTINYLKECKNTDLINKFKNIMDNEQSKFDLLDDFNKDRKHIFELYDDELKEQINSLYINSYQENKKL